MLVTILLFLLTIYKSNININNFNTNYMDKSTTTCINGLLIIIVFCSHARGYIQVDDVLNQLCLLLDQLMVTTFLAYSGYGVATSYIKKDNYLDSFIKKRVLPTYLHYAIAVIIYCALNYVLNIHYDIATTIKAFFAFESIGNSNWYIFVILILYILFYISFSLSKHFDRYYSFLFLISSNIAFIKIMEYLKPDQPWWYCTTLCFLFGVIFAFVKDTITPMVTTTNTRYFITLGLFICTLVYMTPSRYAYSTMYMNLYSIIFVILIILASLKFAINSPFLGWCGSHLFEIYIFQRIPMIVLSRTDIKIMDNYLVFLATSFLFTALITVIMNKAYRIIDRKLKAQ